MDQLKKLEERDKLLTQQIIMAEKESAAKSALIEKHKQEISQTMQQRDEYKIRCEKSSTQQTEVRWFMWCRAMLTLSDSEYDQGEGETARRRSFHS